MDRIVTQSAAETKGLGEEMGRQLPPDSILCFFGDLGAGKTTFIQGLVAGATGCEEVNSPTFVYLNIYPGGRTVYHFDLYRLKSAEEFLKMGFDEYFYAGGICCIEWAERIEALLPPHCYHILMAHKGERQREIQIVQPI